MTKLQKLMEISLDYPVNAMTRVCKKLSMQKKAAVEAISMFEILSVRWKAVFIQNADKLWI